MEICAGKNSFSLIHNAQVILSFSQEKTMLYVGYGKENIDMYRGNFKVEDYVIERYPIFLSDIEERVDGIRLNLENKVIIDVTGKDDLCILDFKCLDDNINRFWFRVNANADEHCYGCGEQMSYFDLRGRSFPLWTSEPGVGRDKTTYITWRSDVENKAGGDYYNTNYPEPTYVSSKHYYLHVDSTAYAEFNFKNEAFHELHFGRCRGK